MNQKQIRAAVEAMLFASGDPIGADKLAQAVQLPQLSVEAALEALRERYAREDSGLCLLHLNTRWQLATKTEWADCIRRLLDSRRAVPLGPAAMETLTVIAYNQPVSRAFIEQVRGVDSSSSVSGLLEKGLIEEAGRLDLPGRPVSFRTTDTFLRVFGLSSLADLPPVHGQETETNASPTESEGQRMGAFLAALGAVLLLILRVIGILLLVVLILLVLLLLCPFCADLCWEHGVLTVKAGALGITFPVFQYPKPEPLPAPENPEPPRGFGKVKAKFAAWRAERKRKKAEEKARKKAAAAAAKANKPAQPRKKAKITLEILCTMLKGAGTLTKAVFGALRITKIQVRLGVRGEDPAAAARSYGKLQAWLYPVLGVLDRFLWLQFDELRILPDFGSGQPTVEDRVSCRVSAQALFIVLAAVRVLYEFWRKKVLDIFL